MVNPLGSEPKRSKYRLLGLVGQGQFGRVFCAVHRRTGRIVALKDLDRHRFPTAKFLRELRFLLTLQHPNIVQFQAVEHREAGRYLVMDYCEGGTLRSLMTEAESLSRSAGLKLVIDILAGLEHAHSQQIIHCDIKPENILLNVTPSGWTARISDFGIARLTQELNDQGWSNTGSPAYMAPERFYGQYSPTSDLYSVGILLYELLIGHRPFAGTPAELMTAHLNQPVVFPQTLPQEWRSILSTALQKLSARRFRSAEQMRTAILTAARGGSLLDAEENSAPLLNSVLSPGSTRFEAQSEETLQSPTTALCPIGDSLQTWTVHGSDRQVTLQSWQRTSDRSTAWRPLAPVQQLPPLPSPVVQLIARSQSCFAVLKESLYGLSLSGNPSIPQPRLIRKLPPGSLVAIEPKGRWLATLMPDAAQQTQLQFEPLPLAKTSLTLAADPLPIALPAQSIGAARLFVLDAHHAAVLCDAALTTAHENKRSGNGAARSRPETSRLGTAVQIWGRKGHPLGALTLPLYLGEVLVTAQPGRLLAVDRHNPGTIVLIDLKPYRILRIGVEITPDFLTLAPWGYLLADRAGKIVLLDGAGQQVGCLIAPEPITAIAALQQHQIAIATWNGLRGSLYSVDLKEVDVDLIF